MKDLGWVEGQNILVERRYGESTDQPRAAEGVAQRPDLVTLLGVMPDRAESGYGWTEPGAVVAGTSLQEVRGFREKPAPVEPRCCGREAGSGTAS
jgi:mannose-1-phosphate guanylyltransferase